MSNNCFGCPFTESAGRFVEIRKDTNYRYRRNLRVILRSNKDERKPYWTTKHNTIENYKRKLKQNEIPFKKCLLRQQDERSI